MRVRVIVARAALAGTVISTSGCNTPLSMFSTASDAAERVSWLGWFMILLSGVVFVGVMITMVAAMLRNRRKSAIDVDLSDPGASWIVWGGAIIPGAVLLAIFIVAMAAMGRFSTQRPIVTIHVTGYQWWWQLDYEFPNLPHAFSTANEVHVPVGQPVRLLVTTGDVIHSFWVPQLQGKLDLIPGDTNDLRIVARRAGTFAGTCAEFCGVQHAHMGLAVVAESPESFQAWAAHQRTPGEAPADSVTRLGARLFAEGPCSTCHSVRGTSAHGQVAPDLTHVGSRATIAAGTLPNTLGNLAGWITNAQALKPGVKMPTIESYSGPELRAVAAYVASLK